MKMPWWLWLVIILVALGASISFFAKGFHKAEVLDNIGALALAFTLIVVSIYTYYTYVLAKDAFTPSASFGLKEYTNDPYQITFTLQNHSKVSLNCWCELNASVVGQPVALGGFYHGESSIDLQPFRGMQGHFDMRDILAKANYSVQEIQLKVGQSDPKELLYLNIEFWYNPVGSNSITRNPPQPRFFDFGQKKFVVDF